MKTASWFTVLPDDHMKIGISRGVPRRMVAGYRLFKKLAPGPWFNSVGLEEYYRRYRIEILGPLDPRAVAAELIHMANDRVPVIVCYERPGGTSWCHRAMAAEWLSQALGRVVPEFGFETLAQHDHPLLPEQLRRPPTPSKVADVTAFVGRTAHIDGELHTVLGADPQQPGRAIIGVGERSFSTGIDTLERHFSGLL